jgi:bifunctional DNase/RNase
MSCSAPSDKILLAIKMAFHILIAKSLSPKELTHEHRLSRGCESKAFSLLSSYQTMKEVFL